ncbi:MAG: ankyrin repeat domain-containing protein [Planctomycetota bacterium]|nr:ankyrin repeat domain-containing protein [Planctomycetota bacterium]
MANIVINIGKCDHPTGGSRCCGACNLHSAAEYGQLEFVKLQLAAGAPVDAPMGPAGYRPIHFACVSSPIRPNKPEIIRLLLSAGAKINSRTSGGQTPLHVAILCSADLAVIEAVLEQGPDLEIRQDGADRYTPLLLVADSSYGTASRSPKAIAEMLLAKGADISATVGGKTALDIARESSRLKGELYEELVRFLQGKAGKEVTMLRKCPRECPRCGVQYSKDMVQAFENTVKAGFKMNLTCGNCGASMFIDESQVPAVSAASAARGLPKRAFVVLIFGWGCEALRQTMLRDKNPIIVLVTAPIAADLQAPAIEFVSGWITFCHYIPAWRGKRTPEEEFTRWSRRLLGAMPLSPAECGNPELTWFNDVTTAEINLNLKWPSVRGALCLQVARALEEAFLKCGGRKPLGTGCRIDQAEPRQEARQEGARRPDAERQTMENVRSLRRDARQCTVCGEPLGWFDRLLGRKHHPPCSSIKFRPGCPKCGSTHFTMAHKRPGDGTREPNHCQKCQHEW